MKRKVLLTLMLLVVGAMPTHAGFSNSLTVDVFQDGNTFVPSNGTKRGSTFIITGYVYPGGTIKDAKFNPAAHTAERIGTFWCRGTFTGNGFEATLSQEYFLTDDSNAIVVEGSEGAGPTSSAQLAVVGGTGKYVNRGGQVKTTRLGFNISNIFNLRSEIHFFASGEGSNR
jgi:hypothetical protein